MENQVSNFVETDAELWLRLMSEAPLSQNINSTSRSSNDIHDNQRHVTQTPQCQFNGRSEVSSNTSGPARVTANRRARRNSLPNVGYGFVPYWPGGRNVQGQQYSSGVSDVYDGGDFQNTFTQQETRGTLPVDISSTGFGTSQFALSPVLTTGRSMHAQQLQQQLQQQLHGFHNQQTVEYQSRLGHGSHSVSSDYVRYQNRQQQQQQYHLQDSFPAQVSDYSNSNRANEVQNILSSLPYNIGRMPISPQLLPQHNFMQSQATNIQHISQQAPPPAEKQLHSYASLIGMAILSSKDKRLSLSDIYTWINENFPFFKKEKSGSWQSSVRHNLTFNESFVKTVITTPDGKRNFWTIDPACRIYFNEEGEYIRHRGGRNKALAKEKAAIAAKKQKEMEVSKQVVESGDNTSEKKIEGKTWHEGKKKLKTDGGDSKDSQQISQNIPVQNRTSSDPDISLGGTGSFNCAASDIEDCSVESTAKPVARTQSLNSVNHDHIMAMREIHKRRTSDRQVIPNLSDTVILNNSSEYEDEHPNNTGRVSSGSPSAVINKVLGEIKFDDLVQDLTLDEQSRDMAADVQGTLSRSSADSTSLSIDSRTRYSVDIGDKYNRETILSTAAMTQQLNFKERRDNNFDSNTSSLVSSMSTSSKHISPSKHVQQHMYVDHGKPQSNQLLIDSKGFLDSLM
eukprot:CFRG4444T1